MYIYIYISSSHFVHSGTHGYRAAAYPERHRSGGSARGIPSDIPKIWFLELLIHFRVAFLDVVIVHKLEQERTNSLQSRGIVGLVLGRDKSGRGAIIVLNLETLKLCKRYHFKLVESENLSKYVDQQLQEPLFKVHYLPRFYFDFLGNSSSGMPTNLENV